MRTFKNLQYGDEAVIKASLEALTDKTTGVEEYRKAFRVLGEELGMIDLGVFEKYYKWVMAQNFGLMINP